MATYIEKVYSTGSVVGVNYVGGLVGYVGHGITVENTYSRASVEGDDCVGGLLGYTDASIKYSYSTGAVTGNTNVGGLIGGDGASITSCYWDTQTSGQATSSGGTGKTTTQMKTRNTYVGWNFNSIWGIDSITNDGYPYLGIFESGTRCYTIPILLDDHGRIAKGARVRVYRDDTGELIKEGVIDSAGHATICGLPNDVDISYHVTWGGGA